MMLCAMAGCSMPQSPAPKANYDLGPLPAVEQLSPATTVQASKPPQRTLQLANTTAPPAMASQDMHYRLLYAQALQPRAYTLASWSMPPAQLVHQRLRRSLLSDGWLIGTHLAANTSVLHVEVDTFEQVFDAPNRSHGLVQWQVSLRQGNRTLTQHTIQAKATAASPDAAGGAQALAIATDDALVQLRTWLNQGRD